MNSPYKPFRLQLYSILFHSILFSQLDSPLCSPLHFISYSFSAFLRTLTYHIHFIISYSYCSNADDGVGAADAAPRAINDVPVRLAVLCCAVLCCAVLYCTVLYCNVLYCAVPYGVVQRCESRMFPTTSCILD